MSYGEWIALAVAVLTGVLIVVVWVRTKPATVEDAAASIRDASEVAQTAVAAAEQLWRTGKLPKTERFDYALGLLQKEFPGLDPVQLRASVEAGVYWLKQAAAVRQAHQPGQPEAAQGLPVRPAAPAKKA